MQSDAYSDTGKLLFITSFFISSSYQFSVNVEMAEHDLADFRDWCDHLVQKCSGTVRSIQLTCLIGYP